MLTVEALAKIMPLVDQSWRMHLDNAMSEFSINTWPRAAAFLANVAHESGECRRIEENLSYSAERLRKVWPSRFPSIEAAEPFARNPERLANYVYAERMGNGDTATGDGWRYRGRGLIQITGRELYFRCGNILGLDLLAEPDLLLEPQNAARSAGWFWYTKKLNAVADAGGDVNFRRIVEAINGGLTGLEDRMVYWERAQKALRA